MTTYKRPYVGIIPEISRNHLTHGSLLIALADPGACCFLKAGTYAEDNASCTQSDLCKSLCPDLVGRVNKTNVGFPDMLIHSLRSECSLCCSSIVATTSENVPCRADPFLLLDLARS